VRTLAQARLELSGGQIRGSWKVSFTGADRSLMKSEYDRRQL